MSRSLHSVDIAVSFADAAAELGISHAALARALERGEIARMAGSARSRPLFRPVEIERYRRLLHGDLQPEPAVAPARREEPAALLLELLALSDESQAAGKLAQALQREAGPGCCGVVLLRLDDDLEAVHVVGTSWGQLASAPVELSASRYRAFREGSGLAAVLEREEPWTTDLVSGLFSFLEPADRAAIVSPDTRRACVVSLLSYSGSGSVAVALYNGDDRGAEGRSALAKLASAGGLALEAVRQRQELVRRTTRAEALQGAARLLARAPDYHDVLALVAELAAELLQADGAAVLTAADAPAPDAALPVGGSYGLAVASARWNAGLSSQHLLGRAALNAVPMQVPDASNGPELYLPRLSGDRQTQAALCVPIIARGALLGALEVYCAQPRAFSDDEVELLAAFAEQAALAVQSLRGQESRQRALLGAVEALASSIEARDGYTGEHCKRAVSRATQTARALGLSEREVETIGLAAALHDIGKIAVPDAILRKPGPLNEGELEVIRRHPVVGEQIVAWVPELREVARLVGTHQERWDGTGYPFGLAGEQIPIGARIIAVVDAYAAMTEDRPYRAGGSHEAALVELQRGRGTQFDPVAVDAFVPIITSAHHGDASAASSESLERALPGQDVMAGGRGAIGYLPVRRWHSRRASELAALNDILRAISSTLDLRKIYDLVFRKVSDLIEVDAFMILEAQRGVSPRSSSGVVVQTGELALVESRQFPIIGTPAFTGLVAESARTGQSVVVVDYPRYLEQLGLPADASCAIGSAIATPIILGEEMLGLISVQSHATQRYDERHVGLLEEIALHVGLALRNAGVYAEARRRAEQFEAIGRLAARLNTLRDPVAIAQAFATESKHVVHSEKCLIFFVQDDRHVLAAIDGDYTDGERAGYRDYTMPRGEGILWWAVERGETVLAPDLARDPRVVPKVRRPHAGESGLIVPLAHEGQPLAVAFMVRSGEPFDDDDAQAMNVLAAHAATAMSDAYSHMEAQRRVRELEALQRAVAIVGANLERKTAVKAIVDVLADVFGYGHVSMYSLQGDTLQMLAQVGYDTPFEELPIDQGVIARCVRTGQSILLRDVRDDPDYLAASAGIRSEVAAPVFRDGKVVGAVNVESDMSRQLGEWDLALIELFSQQVSVALANVSQYEEAVERATIDPVSRLPNHGALMEKVNQLVRDCRLHGYPLSALFIDLDNFKRFNDAFGHRVGDQVLFAVGRYLERRLPGGSYVARYGGEEFVALLPETSLDSAQRIAERIRSQLAQAPLDIAPRERFPVTVSIGVAAIDGPRSRISGAEELLDAADSAMYQAKALGRNRVVRWMRTAE